MKIQVLNRGDSPPRRPGRRGEALHLLGCLADQWAPRLEQARPTGREAGASRVAAGRLLRAALLVELSGRAQPMGLADLQRRHPDLQPFLLAGAPGTPLFPVALADEVDRLRRDPGQREIVELVADEARFLLGEELLETLATPVPGSRAM